jgi:hypothetical protein
VFPPSADITRLLRRWSEGDSAALDELVPLVYERMRKLPHSRLKSGPASRILEQRYFGGLTLEETAAALNVSLATVKRELRSARAWLATQLNHHEAYGPERRSAALE